MLFCPYYKMLVFVDHLKFKISIIISWFICFLVEANKELNLLFGMRDQRESFACYLGDETCQDMLSIPVDWMSKQH